jgi:ABC-type multidrug transport system fused ATPase/permease subunit
VTETTRRVFAFVEPGDRAAWVGLALLGLIVTWVDVAAALLIFQITQLVADAGARLDLPMLGDPRALVPRLTDQQVLVMAMGLVTGFFLLRAGLMLVQSYLRARVAERTGVRLSSRLFRGYLRMPYPFHLQRNSAELIYMVNEAVRNVVEHTLNPALRLASEALTIAALGIALTLIAPLAAIIAAALFVPLLFLMVPVVQRRLADLGRTGHEVGQGALAALQQSLHGFRDITILGRQAYFSEQYERIRKEIGRIHDLQQFLGDVPRISLETALVIFVAVFTATRAAAGGSTRESLAVLSMFAYAAFRILPSLNRMVLQLNDLRFGSAAAADVHRELTAVETSPGTGATSAGGTRNPLPFRRAIRLDGVSYRYPEAERDALLNVTIEINKGESIGVVGPTGGGKSTLLDIILGLLPPTRGRVFVDDVDVQAHLEGWLLNLGVVPQTVYLLDTTLRHNIALGVEDRDIDEGRLRDAICLAQLQSFVASLPKGVDTLVGERGIRVSGGERQRVAIARALYRCPEVLVFDEGTSALDTVTEAELLSALEPLRRDRTLIIVAHRLSTVRNCDRILLVDSGCIADTGSFPELVERNVAFRRLAATPSPDAPLLSPSSRT